MNGLYFKIHPAINFARVGNSEEYYIAPETAAGDIVAANGLMGGLPIKPGTEATPVDDADLRDAQSRLKRQAARFRIFAYDDAGGAYPGGGGVEIKIGSVVKVEVDGIVVDKTVKDIIWTVHVANKKANNYDILSANKEEEGIAAYANGKTPPVRNPDMTTDLGSSERLRKLVIDPGPRAIRSASDGVSSVPFSRMAKPTHADANGDIQTIGSYPVSFPDDHFDMFNAQGTINTLGELTIEKETGRLLVLGGYGRASGIEKAGTPPPLNSDLDNDSWFDDVSDGPVNAVVLFTDDSSAPVLGAWVVTTDPAYAPQTRNVVTTWDDVYNTWVQELGLVPSLYSNGGYNDSYKPSFNDDILPILHAAMLQQWNCNLPQQAIKGHEYVGSIKASDNPAQKIPNFQNLIRNPNVTEQFFEGVRMPLSLGDVQQSFLSVNETQYFYLMQWYQNQHTETGLQLGPGEKLDKVALQNCLGGRYSPGIDLTFIVRDVNLYKQDWRTPNSAPFRINQQPLDYSQAKEDEPFLSVGYIPLRTQQVEPGDLSKFMALPWHTDYNSCATHQPDPNVEGNNTLYWSWPAQRPVAVYPTAHCHYDSTNGVWNLGGQLYSVRGPGTQTDFPQQQGRYQCRFGFVQNWEKVGFVIQGLQIADSHNGNYGSDKFLEVASLYATDGDMVQPWPTSTLPGYKPPANCGPHAGDKVDDE